MNKSAPTKEDCKMLAAIMKAAKQIHEEFDCLSDHVMTARQIREQIAQIIWKHIDSREPACFTERCESMNKSEIAERAAREILQQFGQIMPHPNAVKKVAVEVERAIAESQAPQQRSDKDYAIEHGGYLADAAEQYLKACNAFSAKECTSGCDTADRDLLSDHWRALENAIGEFRKRAKRAESGAAQEVSPPSSTHFEIIKCNAMCWKVYLGNSYLGSHNTEQQAANFVKNLEINMRKFVGGDTRELKAALANLVARLKIIMAWPEPHFSHDLPIEIRKELADAEKLLG